MNSTDFVNKLLKPSRTSIAVVCLLVFHAASAKSEAPAPEAFNKSSDLILSLPDENLDNSNTWSTHSFQQLNNGEPNQIIAGNKKKSPLNVDCGVDVYSQNVNPDVPLSNRLTGACDFKYHY